MSVIVAIDFGEKRTGLAVTDPLKIIASSLTTLKTTLVIDFLIEFSLKNDVEKLVIGLPKQKDNTESFIELKILVFIQKLKNSIPKVKIDRYDERYTSVIAKKTLISSGVGKKKRKNKNLVDSISATILLQSYLERNKKLKI
jgi:putative Holliday junction resolvase